MSCLFLVTASRMRTCARDTASRLCVRTVLCSSAFSLAPPLRSTGSAAAKAALFARFLATSGGSGPQRQLIVPRGKPGRDHDELSGLICDRSIMALAVAQQFHDRGRRSPSGDDRITRWLNAGMWKTGTDLSVSSERGDTASAATAAFVSACAVASAAEPSSRAPDAGGATAVAALVLTDGSRCTCLMPKTRAAPQAATSAKKRHDCSGYRCGSHDGRPVARSLDNPRYKPILSRTPCMD